MSSFINISNYRNLIYLIVLHYTINFQAQIEDIPINKEVSIDRLYFGLLSFTSIKGDNTQYDTFSSLQFGSRVRVELVPKTLQIRSFGVFKVTENQSKKILRSYEAIFTPNEKTVIHFGVMATPTTEIRPNPATWQSQIETNAEKTIIGGRPGIKVYYNFNKNLIISYGIHNHNDNLGQHLKIQYKQLTFSSFIEKSNLFLVAKWKCNKGNILTTKSKDKVNVSTLIPIWSDYKFFTDLEYRTNLQKLTYFDIGLRKHFSSDRLISGFLSISYNNQLKSLQGGIFLHI